MIWNDMFAGGGGTSSGLHNVPGIKVAAALNHWHNAVKTHMINFRDTKHYWADVYDTDEHKLPECDGFWASIDCADHSNAKGGKEKDTGSYMLADELPRFILHCDPSVIVIENVREFLKWGPLCEGKRVKNSEGDYYKRWVEKIRKLGWPNYEYRLINVADFGAHTSRTRLIIQFTKPGMEITWPTPTHAKNGKDSLIPWQACRDKIDLENEGQSIFGRKYNQKLKTHVRRELSHNTKRRIAGGIRKFFPEFEQFLMSYYGNGDNVTAIDQPCPVVTTKDRHVLLTVETDKEKKQFVTDYIWGVALQDIDKPCKTITTRETKQFVTLFYGRDNAVSSIKDSLQVIPTENRHALTSLQFISSQYNSNGRPELNNGSIEDPLGPILTREKHQFISAYFNSGNNPESQNQSIEQPLGAATTVNKKALATLTMNGTFDIRMRFLNYKELAAITGFPDEHKWFGSQKDIIRMIGNAVPPLLSKIIGTECNSNFKAYKNDTEKCFSNQPE